MRYLAPIEQTPPRWEPQMSKLAHSNQKTMDELDRRSAIEDDYDENTGIGVVFDKQPDSPQDLTKHTRGPWTYDGFIVREVASDAGIAVIQNGMHINPNIEIFDLDTQEANARLIAAAPKLLEALKLAEELCANLIDAVGDDEFNSNFKVIEKARSAIAEAEGR